MIVLIDNYDSFSYNLYQLVGQLEPDIRVIRNDALGVAELAALHADALVISPGPGRPADAGICEEAVRALSGTLPIIGVCLGHQAICEAFGGTVGYAKRLMHGKASTATLDASCPLFAGLPERIEVARYHSLAAAEEGLPACLAVTARTDDGEVMGVQHVEHATYGLQFHPESILTPDGRAIIENFLHVGEGEM